MKIYLRLEAPFEWVRVSGQKVEAFGEVASLGEYPIGDDDELYGVVSGEWVTTHRVNLPAKSRKQFNAALPYALEESISEDVENMHFVCPNWKAGEECNVLAVAVEKMREWQALANSNRLPIERLIPDYALVPFHDAAECSIALSDDSVLANHQDGHGVSIDREFMEVWLMDVPMTSTIAVNDEALTEQMIQGHPDRDFRHWPFGNKMAHWLEYLPSSSIDLWADKYRPRVTKQGKHPFMLPIAMALCAIVIKMGYDSYRYFALHSEIKAVSEQSQSLLTEHFPMFDDVPQGQERQMMEQAIARMGGPDKSKSVHSSLAEVAAVLSRQNITLSNIVFRNDELVITCLVNDFSQVDMLAKQFNQRPKLEAALQSSSSDDGQIVASYTIRQN